MSTNGKIGLNIILGVLACAAVGLGVAAYFLIFAGGTQIIQPNNPAPTPTSSVATFIFPSSTLSAANNNASGSPAFGTFASTFSAPYPVAWSEGQSRFAISGATLTGSSLTLTVNVTTGDLPQCVPIDIRLVSDEQGDMAAPTSPSSMNFPLSATTCEGTPNTFYANQPLTFTVDPATAPFLLMTGGASNVYFEVSTTTAGGVDVAFPQQSG